MTCEGCPNCSFSSFCIANFTDHNNRPLQVIAELVSNLEGESDRFKITDHLLKGEICGINRGVDLSEREIVRAIALQLVGLVKAMERGIS